MNMNLSDITVLIPSIGRQSIYKLIEGLPENINIIIGCDYCTNEFIESLKDHLVSNSNVKILEYHYGVPGITKQSLINLVSTDYFMIMDDDDIILPEFWDLAVESINKFNPSWIFTHYIREDSTNQCITTDIIPVTPFNFKDYYFNWDTSGSSMSYKLSHLYPCSEVLVKTADWRLMQLDPIYFLKYDILDDTIPFTKFMSSYYGIMFKSTHILYGLPKDSVSHSNRDILTSTDFGLVISDMARVRIKTENDIWYKVLRNAIEVTNYNIKNY